MKKLIKFILKQFIKCFIFIFVSAICFYCCSHIRAYADYQRTITLDFNGQTSNNHYSDWIDVSNAVSITLLDIQGSASNWDSRYNINNNSSSRYYIYLNTPVDLSDISTFRFYIRSSSGASCRLDSLTYTLVLSGSDPDLGVKSQEQRYNTTTFYSDDFTKSNSLPLIYSGSLFLSDFTPNGNCNSIQVDASTVGGDQLEWRLNLGQSGIDGQTAWLPIGFKMPLQVNQFDEHSIQLRMKDPDDPTQYYNLDPSELSICSVTYGYMTDVYFSLPPGEEQEVDTTDFGLEIPTMDYSSGDAAQVDGLAQYILAVGECTAAIINFSGMSAFIMLMLIITVAYFLIV